jgi:hypothetical protein
MVKDFIQLLEDDQSQLESLTFKLLGDLKTHPELFQMFYSRIMEPRLQHFFQMIERAQARGELRQDLDPLVLIGLFAGPFFYHMLLSGKLAPRSPHWPEQAIDAALNGAAVRHEG